jgi:hypothetical protein
LGGSALAFPPRRRPLFPARLGERRWWDRIGVDSVVAAAIYLHWIRFGDEFDPGACAILAEWRPDTLETRSDGDGSTHAQ